MATYTITVCNVSDGPALAANNIPAWWEDSHWVLPWRHRSAKFLVEQVSKRLPRHLVKDRVTKRHLKALDPETGRILGYARWSIPASHATREDGTPAWPEGMVPAVSPEEEAEIYRVADTAIWDPDSASDVLVEPLVVLKNELLAKKPYMELHYMAVHPDNKGKGVATALVEAGIKEANKLGLDIFIFSMRAPLGLYKRLGFHVEREFIQDDSPYGGNGDHRVYFMIYDGNHGSKEA